MDKKSFTAATTHSQWPPNDLAKIGQAELTADYDRATAEIAEQNSNADAYLHRAELAVESTDTKCVKELPSLRAEKIRLLVNSIQLEERLDTLKTAIRQAYSAHQSAMAAILTTAEVEKVEQLRTMGGGELPHGWSDTVRELLAPERTAAAWEPTVLLLSRGRPSETPAARARKLLRQCLVAEIGIDPTGL